MATVDRDIHDTYIYIYIYTHRMQLLFFCKANLSQHQTCPFGKNRGAGDWYTIYHRYMFQKRAKQTPLLINQPMGKGHL